MATFFLGKMKSGLPGSELFRLQPLIPEPRRAEINFSSVLLFFFDRIAAITCARFLVVSESAIRR